MIFERKYGVATTIDFPLIAFSLTSFHSSLTTTLFAAGDIKIATDYDTGTNTATLPASFINSRAVVLSLTAAELQAKNVTILVVDQTAGKVWEDQAIVIETYGNTTASQHRFDRGQAWPNVNVASVSDDTAAADNLELITEQTRAVQATGTALAMSTQANFVWTASTRSLTDKAGFSLAADQSSVTVGIVSNLGASAAAQVNAECDTALADASVTANVMNTVITNLDVVLSTRSSHSATDAANAVFNATLTSTSFNADTGGKRLTFLDQAVSSITAAINSTDVANAVWGATQSAFVVAGTFGNLLDATISGFAAGGDWTDGEKAQIRFALGISGSSTSGTGGIINSISSLMTTNLDVVVSTRSSHSATDAASAVWNATQASHAGVVGSFGRIVDATISSRSTFDPTASGVSLTAAQTGVTIANVTTVNNFGASATAQINTALSDISTGVAAIQTQTDKMTFTANNIHSQVNTNTASLVVDLNADQSSVTVGIVNNFGASATAQMLSTLTEWFNTNTIATVGSITSATPLAALTMLAQRTQIITASSATQTTSELKMDGAFALGTSGDTAKGATLMISGSGQSVRTIKSYTGAATNSSLVPENSWIDVPVTGTSYLVFFGDPVTQHLNASVTAQVNAEMVDVVNVDAISELAQAAPSATPTINQALMLPYMALRNKLDVTATFKEIHNDAGTVITKKALTDDGTTYSEAEAETGP